MRFLLALSLLLGLSVLSFDAEAAKITVITYNVESDSDTNPDDVAEDIKKIGRAHLWGLTEVESGDAARTFMNAMSSQFSSASFRYFVSRSGVNYRPERKDDRMAIIYSSRVFKLMETQELHFIRVTSGLRAALVGRFMHKSTGKEFLFVVQHLKCCGNGIDKRKEQLRLFKDWARDQKLPIIAVGDWNTPVELGSGSMVESSDFKAISSGGPFDWVKPTNPIKTQCSPDYNSMLDHIFASGVAHSSWSSSSEILFTEQAYCDREKDGTADHRPVRAIFDIQ